MFILPIFLNCLAYWFKHIVQPNFEQLHVDSNLWHPIVTSIVHTKFCALLADFGRNFSEHFIFLQFLELVNDKYHCNTH